MILGLTGLYLALVELAFVIGWAVVAVTFLDRHAKIRMSIQATKRAFEETARARIELNRDEVKAAAAWLPRDTPTIDD